MLSIHLNYSTFPPQRSITNNWSSLPLFLYFLLLFCNRVGTSTTAFRQWRRCRPRARAGAMARAACWTTSRRRCPVRAGARGAPRGLFCKERKTRGLVLVAAASGRGGRRAGTVGRRGWRGRGYHGDRGAGAQLQRAAPRSRAHARPCAAVQNDSRGRASNNDRRDASMPKVLGDACGGRWQGILKVCLPLTIVAAGHRCVAARGGPVERRRAIAQARPRGRGGGTPLNHNRTKRKAKKGRCKERTERRERDEE